jgi:nucleotide-binding universal stress UspA family protein
MIKTMVVPVTGDGTDEAAVRTAVAVARLFGAHLEFLLTRVDVMAVVTAAGGSEFGAGLAIPELLADLEKQDQERATRMRRFFEKLCTREGIPVVDGPPGPHGISAAWREEKGDEWSIVVRRTRLSDLLVIRAAREGKGPAPQTIEAVLIGGGRPVLLVPPNAPASPLRTIVVAWKDTPEAARALTAAMPFLAEADKIIALTVGESEEDDLASLTAVAEYLRWHRFEVESRRVASDSGSAPQALMRVARDAKADLIVMGGYGHSRVREIVFGGFTQHMLESAELPVLLFH